MTWPILADESSVRSASAAPVRGEPGRRRVVGAVLVLDPGAEAFGGVGQSIDVEPERILVEGLVQVFGAEPGDVAVIDGEAAHGLPGRLAVVHHQVDRRCQPRPVCARLAVDEEGVLASSESVDQGQEFASRRPAGCVEGQVEERDAHGARGLHLGPVPPVLRGSAAKVEDRGKLVILDDLSQSRGGLRGTDHAAGVDDAQVAAGEGAGEEGPGDRGTRGPRSASTDFTRRARSRPGANARGGLAVLNV